MEQLDSINKADAIISERSGGRGKVKEREDLELGVDLDGKIKSIEFPANKQ